MQTFGGGGVDIRVLISVIYNTGAACTQSFFEYILQLFLEDL